MVIPSVGPVTRVLVNGILIKVVDKPKVVCVLGIETLVGLQKKKKILPFLAEASGNVNPESFDPCIVNASSLRFSAILT